METKGLVGNGELLVERVETPRGISIPNGREIIAYGFPMEGPGTFKDVMAAVDKRGTRQTTRQAILLADLLMQNENEPHLATPLTKFKQNYFWTSTQATSFVGGVFFYDNVDGTMPSSSDKLTGLCLKKDSRVRFVEPGFRTGAMPISKFLKHPVVIAHIGEEMIDAAERLVKKCYQKEAYVYAIDRADKDTLTYSALGSRRDDGGLGLYCYYDLSDNNGYAFPVSLASTEGAKPK
jgi:hypothetical protein